jgi:hypothetical protein
VLREVLVQLRVVPGHDEQFPHTAMLLVAHGHPHDAEGPVRSHYGHSTGRHASVAYAKGRGGNGSARRGRALSDLWSADPRGCRALPRPGRRRALAVLPYPLQRCPCDENQAS